MLAVKFYVDVKDELLRFAVVIAKHDGKWVFCGEAGLDAEISGGYTSDLLSDVMGHIDEGMLWVTMQTHQNIVAVATLKDVAAVLIVNGASPDEETLEKGKEEDVPLLGTPLSAFEVTGKIYSLLQQA